MRLAGQVRGGFFPCAPEAIDAVLDHLRPPAIGDCLCLDPCCGQAMALLQLAQGLGDNAIPYGIELDEGRAALAKVMLDDDKALCPADFLRTLISHGSFSLCFCNPPYDDATGGVGRVESQFVRKAAGLLADGGVLCLVCPQDVAESYSTINFFEESFDQISALPFPAEVRKYSETVVMGRKRKSPAPIGSQVRHYEWLDRMMAKNIIYDLPPGRRPKVFRKSEPTDAELSRLVAASPLRFLLEPMADAAGEMPRPPLSIGVGHRALLLASGFVDGLIQPPDELAHVIRGSATKSSYVSSCETTEDDDGNSKTVTVVSEKPQLVIRVLTANGEIVTLE